MHREYYINDAGRQMDILGLSVWLRWLEAQGTEVPFPTAGYRGEYIREIAAAIDTAGISAARAEDVLDGVPADEPGGDKEEHVAALIARAKTLLGDDDFHKVRQQSLESICRDIENDLTEFGVEFDHWYSEQSLERDGRIDAALDVLRERNMLYVKDGATWFQATKFGDEKDRVVVRENGVKTYFAHQQRTVTGDILQPSQICFQTILRLEIHVERQQVEKRQLQILSRRVVYVSHNSFRIHGFDCVVESP